MKFILGKKIEMSQLFDENGEVVPVTKVEAGPCLVTQVKNKDKDGYAAVQIGFGKKKKLSKALKGHLKGFGDFRWLREFRLSCLPEVSSPREEGSKNTETLKHLNTETLLNLTRGDKITASAFEVGDVVKVSGISKGKGFQGVVRRHGFHGHPKTHGHKDQERMPGSIGPSEPARVFPGMRMPGQMGNARVTVKNLEIVKIDKDKNILYLRGAVPGSRGSLVEIRASGQMKIQDEKLETKKQSASAKATADKEIKDGNDEKGNKEIEK